MLELSEKAALNTGSKDYFRDSRGGMWRNSLKPAAQRLWSGTCEPSVASPEARLSFCCHRRGKPAAHPEHESEDEAGA